MMSGEHNVVALRKAPSYEDIIRGLRRCRYKCPMVDSLDSRMKKQRALVRRVLARRDWELDDLLATDDDDLPDDELKMCKRIWLDTEYIDNLR